MNSPLRYRVFPFVIGSCLAMLACFSSPLLAKDASVFRAGAAMTNITPPLGELIVGGWAPLPADEVHDELHARCLVLDDGQTKLALVLCDNVGIPREVFDAAKTLIEDSTGIPKAQQLMASTHTHSAASARSPNVMAPEKEFSSYQQFLVSRIHDGVRIAVKRLQPAKIGWGFVDEPSEVFNRRWYVQEEEARRNPFGGVDQVRMNPGSCTLIRPAGPVDPQIGFISVQTKEGVPLSVLANYSLHYVGGVPARTISADYFAVFAEHLQSLIAPSQKGKYPFVGILSNGTSGDVNNINFRERGARREPFEKILQVGELVARRVAESLEKVQYQDWVALSGKTAELTLQVRKPDAALTEIMRTAKQRPENEPAYHVHEKIYADRVQMLLESPDQVSVLLQAFKLGDLAICAIPFEVFAEIGLELKSRSPHPATFTIELANGSYGYLPTPSQHDLGGYETWMGTSKVEKEASEKIVETLLGLLNE